MSAPHHSFFTGWMLFLTPNHQSQSTEGKSLGLVVKNINLTQQKETTREQNGKKTYKKHHHKDSAYESVETNLFLFVMFLGKFIKRDVNNVNFTFGQFFFC